MEKREQTKMYEKNRIDDKLHLTGIFSFLKQLFSEFSHLLWQVLGLLKNEIPML